MGKEKFLFEATLKSKTTSDSTDEATRIVEGFVATTDKDTDGDVIDPSALEEAAKVLVEQYNTLLYNHDTNRPIGKVVDADVKTVNDRKGLWIKAIISKTENEIWTKIQEGVLSKFSFWAYVSRVPVYSDDDQTAIDYYRIVKIFPYEASLVSVPANPNAVALDWYVEKAFNKRGEEMKDDDSVKKGSNKEKPKVKIDNSEVSHRAWSQVDKTKLGNILFESGNERAINEAFAYVPDVEKRSTWKFPHHELQKEGDNEYVLVLSYPGLMAFYKALRGARRKPKLPESAMKAAISHCRKHFRQLISMGEYDEMPEGLKSKVKSAIAWLDSELKEPLTKEEVMEGLKELITKMKEAEGDELKALIEEMETLVEELPEEKQVVEVKTEIDYEEMAKTLKELLAKKEEETEKDADTPKVDENEVVKELKDEIESLKKELEEIKNTVVVKGTDVGREEEPLSVEDEIRKEIESEDFAKKSPSEQLSVLRKLFDNK